MPLFVVPRLDSHLAWFRVAWYVSLDSSQVSCHALLCQVTAHAWHGKVWHDLFLAHARVRIHANRYRAKCELRLGTVEYGMGIDSELTGL